MWEAEEYEFSPAIIFFFGMILCFIAGIVFLFGPAPLAVPVFFFLMAVVFLAVLVRRWYIFRGEAQ